MMDESNPGGPQSSVMVNFTLSWDGRSIAPGGTRREEAARFRELAAAGLLDEVCITWRPCILGGKSAPPITGASEEFFPRGIELRLVKIERIGDQCRARYRLRRP